MSRYVQTGVKAETDWQETVSDVRDGKMVYGWGHTLGHHNA